MKKIIFCLLFAVVSSYTNAQNSYYVEQSSFSTGVQYNDYLVELISLVDEQWTLAIEDSIMNEALVHSKKMNEISGLIIKTLKKIQPYDSDVDFIGSSLKYVEHMNKISKKELPEFIKIIRDYSKPLTPALDKRAEKLIPILDDKRNALFDEFDRQQKVFAKKHGFILVYD